MRINRDILTNLAHEEVKKRIRNDPGVVTAYLCGSLLEENYLLGGTTDIDLVFVHISQPECGREIVRLSAEIHLDIAHHAQKEYEQPRNIRSHAWLGPAVYSCLPLYDVNHFMDFTQASVRGQFNQPEMILQRAKPQVEHARQIWFSLQDNPEQTGVDVLSSYLSAVEHAANSIALLSGGPLTERRFLMNFSLRAEAAGSPGLFPGLLGLLGGAKFDREQVRTLLPDWETALLALPQPVNKLRLHPHRRSYYRRAFEAMLEMGEPRLILWPLINTWTLAAKQFAEDSPEWSTWNRVCLDFELVGPAFKERVEALDAYLDQVEETIDRWASAMGV